MPAIVNPSSLPTTGFYADPTDSNSFIGLKIANSIPNQPATLLAEGNLTIFGF